MLLKCCPQSVSRFVKLRSGRGQFSFQFQRKAMPKNVQTTIQLCSFHMLARFCSKSFRLGLSSTWTKNILCMGWVSKRQRNQRSNCHHSLGCGESKGVPGKKSTFASLTMLKALTVWISTNCGKFWKRWESATTLPVSWGTCTRVRKQTENWTWNHRLAQNRKEWGMAVWPHLPI